MKQMRTLYHATDFANLNSILDKGIETRNMEHIVYACETPNDCLKFARIHGCGDVLVVEFSVPEKEVFETFDHSEAFFKCRCFGVARAILPKEFKKLTRYTW